VRMLRSNAEQMTRVEEFQSELVRARDEG